MTVGALSRPFGHARSLVGRLLRPRPSAGPPPIPTQTTRAIAHRYPWLRIQRVGEVNALSPFTGSPDVGDDGQIPDIVVVDAPSRGGPKDLSPSAVADGLISCEQHAVPTVIFADAVSDAEAPTTQVARMVVSSRTDVTSAAARMLGPERTMTVPELVDTGRFNPAHSNGATTDLIVLLGHDGAIEHELQQRLAGTATTVAVLDPRRESHPDELSELSHRASVVILTDPSQAAPRAHALCLALAACGVPIVAATTTPMLDAEALTPTEGDVTNTAVALTRDQPRRHIASIRTRRAVLLRNNLDAWLDALLPALGIPSRPSTSVSLIAPLTNSALLPRLRDNVHRQQHPVLETIVVTRARDAALVKAHLADWEVPTRIVTVSAESGWADHLNAGSASASGECLALLDQKALYGPFHVTDLLLALSYSSADLVGRRERFVYDSKRNLTTRTLTGSQEQPTERVITATALLPREIALRFGFARRVKDADAWLAEQIRAAGGKVYATHPFDTVLSGRVRTEVDDHLTTIGEDAARAMPFGDGGVPVRPLPKR